MKNSIYQYIHLLIQLSAFWKLVLHYFKYRGRASDVYYSNRHDIGDGPL